MREKAVELKPNKTAQAWGGLALKRISPGFNGVPVGPVLLPHGKLALIELTRQEKRQRQLKARSFLVFCLDGIEQMGGILDAVQSS